MTEVVRPGSYVSLFSGIGGLDLAVEAFFGYEPAAFVEWDASCQRILARHWPDVRLFGDVREFGATALADADQPSGQARSPVPVRGPAGGGCGQAEPLGDGRQARVDLVAGGFPCQDLSAAGKRSGFKGDRSSLFYELARVVSELGPRYVLLENVRGLLTATGAHSDERGAAMAEVTGTLADLGFTRIDWVMVGASDVGAPHRRHRIFILASRTPYGVISRLQGHTGDGVGSDESRRVVSEPDGPAPPPHLFTPPDAQRPRWEPRSRPDEGDEAGERRGRSPDGSVPPPFGWGVYEPAIRKWERVMGPAPHPVDERNRLSADFVTWLQAFPAGWNEGESRANRLKQLGNAVVWLQAYRALKLLSARVGVIQPT